MTGVKSHIVISLPDESNSLPSHSSQIDLPKSAICSDYSLNSSRTSEINAAEQIEITAAEEEENTRPATETSNHSKMGNSGPIVISVLVGLLVTFSLILTIAGIRTIEAGHLGVLKKWGKVQDVGLKAGLHFINPISSSLMEVDLRLQSVTFSSIASSMDLQEVKTEAALQYKLNPAMVPKAVQKIGDRSQIENVILTKAMAESLKAATSKFTAESLITSRQQVKIMIRNDIEVFLEEATKDDKLDNLIILTNLAITDFEFSEAFNRAIEAKVRSKQEALQAENIKRRIVTEAQAAKLKKETETDARTYEIEQMAAAEALRISSIARARASAIELEAKALKDNANLLKLRTIEKWDGELPTFNGGESIPMINFDDIAEIS